MQAALIHSTRERKRLPSDGRQDKEAQLSSVSYTEAKRSRGKSSVSLFFFWFQSVKARQEPGLIEGDRGPIRWAGLELSRIRWSSHPGFKTSRGGRGLTGFKGDRRYHLCHLLVDGDSGDTVELQ